MNPSLLRMTDFRCPCQLAKAVSSMEIWVTLHEAFNLNSWHSFRVPSTDSAREPLWNGPLKQIDGTWIKVPDHASSQWIPPSSLVPRGWSHKYASQPDPNEDPKRIKKGLTLCWKRWYNQGDGIFLFRLRGEIFLLKGASLGAHSYETHCFVGGIAKFSHLKRFPS